MTNFVESCGKLADPLGVRIRFEYLGSASTDGRISQGYADLSRGQLCEQRIPNTDLFKIGR
jgi:hypothetical protein